MFSHNFDDIGRDRFCFVKTVKSGQCFDRINKFSVIGDIFFEFSFIIVFYKQETDKGKDCSCDIREKDRKGNRFDPQFINIDQNIQ